MTTFAQARAELATALASVGNGATSAVGKKAVPYVLLAGGGAEPSQVVRGAVDSTWRIILVAGAWEADTSAAALDTMKQAAMTALRGLANWQVEALGTDTIRTLNVSDQLTAELRGIRQVDI